MAEIRYVTYEMIETILKEAYSRGTPLDVLSLYPHLLAAASGRPTPVPGYDPPWGSLSDADFREIMNTLPILLQEPVVSEGKKKGVQVSEEAAFAVQQGYYHLMTHRQYNYLLEGEHAHDYIEIYFLFSGTCRIAFSDKTVTLNAGDMIFLAPHSRHRLESNRSENFILDLSVRGTGFEELFRQQLANDSVLSSFFRKIIFENADLRYLLFHTGEDAAIRGILKQIAMETNLRDTYNEILYTSWANILFSTLLRSYYETVETDPPLENSDFTRVLKYISDHYADVTLDDLTRRFHYSKPHLCNLIKANTGRTLTALVNAQKLTKAETLLLTTDYSVEEIAERIGFAGADYFTRLFRKHYGVTPGKFRRSSRN